MLPLWIPVTLAASALQVLRTVLQRRLVGRLSTTGATYVRYLFGAPLAALMLGGYLGVAGEAAPALGWRFLGLCALGGVAQIVGTVLMLNAFRLRNFAVGTTYTKTEAVITALVATAVLGERLSSEAWSGILVSLIGVFVLSLPAAAPGGRLRWAELGGPAAAIGILSGAAFAVTAVSIRAAALSLGDAGFMARSLATLAGMTVVQLALMTLYLIWRDRAQFAAVLRHWRRSAMIGVTSVLGSVGWFTAFTLETPAKVTALGQIELVIAMLVARRTFGERLTRAEVAGIALIGAGILVLLAGR